jgi:hypothetical protein
LTGDYLQECGDPARNFASLAAICARERRGKGRGGRGIFIGTDGASFYCPNQWDLIREKLHCGFYSGGRNGLGKKNLTGGSYMAAGESASAAYRFGALLLGRGCFNFWAERFPQRPFSIFIFLSSFLFLIFLFPLYLLQI